MRKALAILATVVAVGATTVTAPAEARGIGPGLAFGLATGAIAAGPEESKEIHHPLRLRHRDTEEERITFGETPKLLLRVSVSQA